MKVNYFKEINSNICIKYAKREILFKTMKQMI